MNTETEKADDGRSSQASGSPAVREYLRKIADLTVQIGALNTEARLIQPVDARTLRLANPSDIVVGAIIWREWDGPSWQWRLVCEVLNPNSDFKAFVCNDGCRVGLHGSYVESENAELSERRDNNKT